MNKETDMNNQNLTEEQIEYIVEKHIDELDHRLMHNDLSQEEYDQAVVIIDKWASQQLKALH
jgi:flavorubredoxin